MLIVPSLILHPFSLFASSNHGRPCLFLVPSLSTFFSLSLFFSFSPAILAYPSLIFHRLSCEFGILFFYLLSPRPSSILSSAALPFPASGEGIYMSTLLGLITGFLFPLLPFSLFREPPSPDFFHPLVEEPVAGGVAEGPFRLRGRQSGDWVVGVAFGPRMQVRVMSKKTSWSLRCGRTS